MMNEPIPVYEYWDGYEEEPEEYRQKVRYFVLGDVDDHLVGICYTDDFSHIAVIGKRTHSRAWPAGSLTKAEATECLKKSYRTRDPTLDEYRKKRAQVLEAKPPPAASGTCGTSCSFWGTSFHWDKRVPESYSANFAAALQKKIRVFELREAWLENLSQA
jgi:hypothetical protein